MKISDIKTKAHLQDFLSRHATVKNSQLLQLIDKSQAILGDSSTADLIIRHNFFQKFDILIGKLLASEHLKLIDSVVQNALANKRISLLCEIDKKIGLNDTNIKKLFELELEIDDLIVCLKTCPPHSLVFDNAIQLLKFKELKTQELLFLLNFLNQFLFGKNSIVMSLFYEELHPDLIWNTSEPVKGKQTKSLKELRDYVINKGFKNISEPFYLHFLIDLVVADDQKKLEMNPELKSWTLYELKLKNELNSPVFFLHQFEAIDLSNYGSFDEIWGNFDNATSLNELNIWFNVLKLHLFQVHYFGIENDIDYDKLLSHKLTAGYFKNLHDSNIIEDVPLMSDIFNWPSFNDVKKYLRNFEVNFRSVSPLGDIGYSVAQYAGLSKHERQTKLRDAFLKRDFKQLKEYDWAEKGSHLRLKAIANHIAGQIRMKGHTSQDNSEAIEKWKEDLDYLKSEFYDGKFVDDFIWPTL